MILKLGLTPESIGRCRADMLANASETKVVGLHSLSELENATSDYAFSKNSVLKIHSNVPEHFPKFQACNTPICPLEMNWDKRSNHSVDATCHNLIKSVIDGAEGHYQASQLINLIEKVAGLSISILTRHRRIGLAVERARNTGSKMEKDLG